MLDKLEQIRAEGFDRISGAPDREKLEMIRKELTGKKSSLQEVLKSLGGLDPDMRKSVGMKANEVKNLFAEKIRQKEEEPALIEAYLSHIDEASVHVTYNGASFDIPFIKNRARL